MSLDFNKLKIDKQQDHIAYNDEYHVYWNINTLEQYTSVTTFVKQFEHEVDWDSIKKAISKRDGISVEEIEKKWEKEKVDGCEYGSHYHEFEEHTIMANGGLTFESHFFPFLDKLPEEPVERGVLVEQIVYSDKLKLAGQADIILLSQFASHILDHKTNKKLKFKAHVDFYTRLPQYMKAPLGHLECCNFTHYMLQLNLYHIMLRKMRPKIKRGNRRILYFDKQYEIPFMNEEMLLLGLSRKHQLSYKQR